MGLFLFFHKFTMLYFSPVASRTCDLEAKPIIKKLIICKCPNSVHLESIVEKEEKPINWRSAKQVLGSQFFSAFTSFFSSSFFSVSFFPSDALSFTESSSSFSATLFAPSVLTVTEQIKWTKDLGRFEHDWAYTFDFSYFLLRTLTQC